MRLRPAVFVASLAFTFAITFAVAQSSPQRHSNAADDSKHFITEKDLFDFVWIGDPQVPYPEYDIRPEKQVEKPTEPEPKP